MIYLFVGDDTKNKHKGYRDFIKSIPKGPETFFISKNEFNKSEISNFYSGSSLFFKRCNVVFTNISDREGALDFVLENLDNFQKSESVFVFLDGRLDKKTLEYFKEAGAKINVFELPKEKKEKFNNFLLADAFSVRDRFHLWVYFRQAMNLGVGMEELVGVLFWKAKDLILKKNFAKFKKDELQNFAAQISYLLPSARKAGFDAEMEFERFLLSAF